MQDASFVSIARAGAAFMPHIEALDAFAASAAEADGHWIQSGTGDLKIFKLGIARILRDVLAMMAKVVKVSNAMLVEPSLPKNARKAGFRAHGVRESALDALNAPLQGLVRGRGHEQMEVVRHDDEGMQRVAFLVAIMEEGFAQGESLLACLKDASAIGSDDGDEKGLQDRPHVARLGDAAGFR
jgi:hypothetical protein